MSRLPQATAVLALVCALAAHAQAPPVDPWADTAWQDVLSGLAPGTVTRVQATQQLFGLGAASAPPASQRDVTLEFGAPGGRVSRLVVVEARRGEARSERSFRYVYDAGRLQRIDEDGQAVPAVVQRHDADGRVVERSERTGAVVARTTWRHDAAGRVVERVTDSGTGSRVQETRRWRRDGTLERLQVKGGSLAGKVVEFDADERPVRVQVTDLLDRHETLVTYPSPTEAVHATTGFAATRDRFGRYEYTTHYQVRTPQELRGAEAPELPTMRRDDRGTANTATRTDYDAAGRVLAEHQLDAAGAIVCSGRFAYHPSGPPLAVRYERLRPDAPCGGSDFDNEVQADARGAWAEQRMTMVLPGGQRRVVSVQTRRVEYAPQAGPGSGTTPAPTRR